MNHLQLPDYLLIGAYIVLVMIIGMVLKRSIKGAKDYFTAGSTMPWWVAGVSYFMASFSTMLFIIYCEIAYNYGLVAFTVTWVAGGTVAISGTLMAHRWRRARVMTPMGFMERRYSKSIHQLMVWLGFPLRMLDNSMRIYGIALVSIVAVYGIGVVKVIDQNPQWFLTAVFALGILFILYSLLGGQSSVMITDFVQAMILLVTVCIITYMCMPAGWWDKLHDPTIVPTARLKWFQESLGREKGYDWIFLTFNIFLISVIQNAAGWALVQKYNCVRSEADARKMVWWVVCLKAVCPFIFFLPGLAAYYLLTPAEIGGNTRYVFALVSFKVLPVGVAGLMMLAMLGSAFSAMGAEYNTLSGVLTRDFYKRSLRPQATPAEEVFFGRMATIGIGLFTMVLALVFNYFRDLNLMDLMMRFFGVFGPPAMIPIFLGLLTKKGNSRGVWYGVILSVIPGIIAVAWNLYAVKLHAAEMKADPYVDYLYRTLFAALLSPAICILVVFGMVIGSVLHPRSADEQASVDAFFEDLKKPYLIDKKAKGISPFKLIGMMAFWFGVIMAAVTAFIYFNRVQFGVQSFGLHLIVIAFMCTLGGLMWWRSARPEPAAEVAAPEPKIPAGVK
ncbi:MAG: hypothetical protein ABFD69_01585 [Candidatus Sumerlaeia bacterium]